MSFLSELVHRRNELTHTTTRVTTPGGHVFCEEREENGYSTCQLREKVPGFVVDENPDLEVAKVLPGLMMGSQDVAADLKVLKENSVTHVLNVGHDFTIQYPGISYTQVQLLDLPETDLLRSLPQCLAVIDGVREQGGTVFVHCNAGVSRSAAVTIAYVMQDELISFHEAYSRLKELRPAIQPNIGFINQLKLYEKELGM
uniref:Dual specificity protein phosphatase 19 n=1 Tax=Lygus hesperus TaxID=30085 RepID=A0A0A9WDN4_LYGHE